MLWWRKDKAEKDGGVVNIYSSRKEELIKDILHAFTQKTGIKVNHVFDDPTKLISRIKSEGKKTHADLFITADVLNLILAAKKTILYNKRINISYATEIIPESTKNAFAQRGDHVIDCVKNFAQPAIQLGSTSY